MDESPSVTKTDGRIPDEILVASGYAYLTDLTDLSLSENRGLSLSQLTSKVTESVNDSTNKRFRIPLFMTEPFLEPDNVSPQSHLPDITEIMKPPIAQSPHNDGGWINKNNDQRPTHLQTPPDGKDPSDVGSSASTPTPRSRRRPPKTSSLSATPATSLLASIPPTSLSPPLQDACSPHILTKKRKEGSGTPKRTRSPNVEGEAWGSARAQAQIDVSGPSAPAFGPARKLPPSFREQTHHSTIARKVLGSPFAMLPNRAQPALSLPGQIARDTPLSNISDSPSARVQQAYQPIPPVGLPQMSQQPPSMQQAVLFPQPQQHLNDALLTRGWLRQHNQYAAMTYFATAAAMQQAPSQVDTVHALYEQQQQQQQMKQRILQQQSAMHQLQSMAPGAFPQFDTAAYQQQPAYGRFQQYESRSFQHSPAIAYQQSPPIDNLPQNVPGGLQRPNDALAQLRFSSPAPNWVQHFKRQEELAAGRKSGRFPPFYSGEGTYCTGNIHGEDIFERFDDTTVEIWYRRQQELEKRKAAMIEEFSTTSTKRKRGPNNTAKQSHSPPISGTMTPSTMGGFRSKTGSADATPSLEPAQPPQKRRKRTQITPPTARLITPPDSNEHIAPPPVASGKQKSPTGVDHNIMMASQKLVAHTQQTTPEAMLEAFSSNGGTPPLQNLSATQKPIADLNNASAPSQMGDCSQLVAGSSGDIDFDLFDAYIANPFSDFFDNDRT
jgi:hypothetical protein